MAATTEEEEQQWSGLSHLLGGSSKEVVENVLQVAFSHRDEYAIPDLVLATLAKSFQIEPLQAKQLFLSARFLVSTVLQSGASDKETIAHLFPAKFNNDLKTLLSTIIAKNITEWKRQVLSQQVSLPRLESFDWRVDVKLSSTCAARMAMPTCILQMKVNEGREKGKGSTTNAVSVEFSPETLNTMLDGLGKIRDQLASVATK